MRRALAGSSLIAALVVTAVGAAPAQEPYPTRPISIVVAFPPGGLADNTARPVASALERILKQPVAIINKASAAGAVGNQTVAISKPDGYTLLMALVSVSVLPEVDKLFGRPQNYTLAQLTGIARINADPSMLVVRADAPWKTLKDALNLQLAYDEGGQRLTATLMDYVLATAADAPRTFELRHLESPTPLNPLGAKGAGEGGIMPVHPLIAQAIEDALAPFGHPQIERVPVARADIHAIVRAARR